jgi:hypothetical protein
MDSNNDGGSRSGRPARLPKNLGKMKTALRKIVSVPKAEVDRRIAEERKQKRAARQTT